MVLNNNISALVNDINNSLAWIKTNRPKDYDQKFLQLVEQRRILNKIARAAENNPGIAAFGKSQVGKSYLISCLLQDNGKPFMVKTEQEEYNFVFRINPPSEEGGGRESTGVVTRFSSYSRNPEKYSAQYPVTVKTFSVADIVTILSDSYFNDFANYTTKSEKEIEETIDTLKSKYGNQANIPTPVVGADDILNIKEYFIKHINNAQVFNKTPFFDHLATFIEHVPLKEYASVFAILWNNESNLTKLFNKLFNILAEFNFASYIYLPIDAVLHKDLKENTIMSVQCLKQLFEASSIYTTDVYTKEGNAFTKRATAISKSDVCAICSEVIFKIEESFLQSSGKYCTDNISPEVTAKIRKDNITMDMLRENDLLDFPGARAREQEDVEKLSEDSILLNCYLRGKVAYLFNKYNADKTINVLLYCHHNKDNDVTSLYKLLQDWVQEYVGKTPQERQEKLMQTKISPLFYIGTMFNLDMTLGVGATASEEAINQRWIGRFDTVMNKQCFHTDTVDWVNNWTEKGVGFKNSYVLRDYKFSGPKSGLYQGFEETSKEQSMLMSEQYYKMMRSSFVKNQYVKQLFSDPELAWDLAASINNDGALYIMENLAEVAQRMDNSRENDFEKTFKKVQHKVYGIMKDYYVSTDANELLEENIRKAKSIFREMDFTCNADNYYFGHLLQALQLNEVACYNIIHRLIQSPELTGDVNDFKDYEIIRNSCVKAGFPLENATTLEEKWTYIINTYGFSTRDEAEDFLAKKRIDVQKLFSGTFKKKLNSYLIAENVFNTWCSTIKSVDFLNQFSSDDSFDNNTMTTLVDNMILTATTLKLHDRMAEAIAEYVNVVNVHTAKQELLADILASMINGFVMDFGYQYLPEEEITKVKKICQSRNISAFKYISKEMPTTYTEEDLTEMFNELSTSPKAILPSFEDNYNKWIEYMFISFLANLNVPDFDHQANQSLAEILDRVNTL